MQNNMQASINVRVNLNPHNENVMVNNVEQRSECSCSEDSNESNMSTKHAPAYTNELTYEPIRLDHDPKNDQYSLAGAKEDIKETSLLYQLKHQKKKVQLAVCITLFNEGPEEFQKTIRGVYRAFYELIRHHAYLETEMAVILIADGFEFLDKDFTKYAEGKFYRGDDLKGYVQEKGGVAIAKEIAALDGMDLDRKSMAPTMFTKNFLHLFQARLTAADILQIEGDRIDLKRIRGGELSDRLAFFLGAKHRNAGKIDSHMWFFRGFCSYFDPKYCLMLDVGTEPLEKAVTHLVTAMEIDPQIGGCCGEIEVEFSKSAQLCSSPGTFLIVAAQFIEYKLAHYMDKSFESFFGFVSVLPGAFSAFRWDAIQDEPLDRFFKGRNKDDHSCFEANMYLAEDRVMCLELLVKPESNYILKYIPGSKAVTDPPLHLQQLIKQRRRWINGSTFATFHFIQNFWRLGKTHHSCCRKLGLYLFFLYYIMNTLLTFLLVGSFYGAFAVFLRDFFGVDETGRTYTWSDAIQNVYLIVLLALLILSLTVRPDRSTIMYTLATWVLGIFMIFMVVITVAFFITKRSSEKSIALVFIIAAMASYVVPLILNTFRLITHASKIIIGLPTYIMITPTYVNTFVIYAFANLHDVSWGNRQTIEDPVEKKRRENLEEDYKGYRKNILLVWLILNMGFAYGLMYLAAGNSGNKWILILSIWIGSILYLRMAGAILYKFTTTLCAPCRRKKIRQFLQKKKREEKRDEMRDKQAAELAAIQKDEEEESDSDSDSDSDGSDNSSSSEENSQMCKDVDMMTAPSGPPVVVNVMLGNQPNGNNNYQNQNMMNNGIHRDHGLEPVNLDPVG